MDRYLLIFLNPAMSVLSDPSDLRSWPTQSISPPIRNASLFPFSSIPFVSILNLFQRKTAMLGKLGRIVMIHLGQCGGFSNPVHAQFI